MSCVEIRRAELHEVYRFFDYVIETYQRGLHPTLFGGHRLGHDSEAFIAKQDGKIVGAVTLSFDGENGPTLDVLYVVPPSRRSKIGSQLCEVAVRRFIERNCTPIRCDVQSLGMKSILEQLPDELRNVVDADTRWAHIGLELPEDDG